MAHEHRGPMLFYVCCVLNVFLRFKLTDFVGNTNTIYTQCMFNFIYIYSFVPMSGCVGIGPSALLFPGARDAVKTALLLLLSSKKL